MNSALNFDIEFVNNYFVLKIVSFWESSGIF